MKNCSTLKIDYERFRIRIYKWLFINAFKCTKNNTAIHYYLELR